MGFNLPVFKQCCCLSLRRGLIVWGFFKVLFSCSITILLSVILSVLPILPIAHGKISEYVFLGIILILAVIDIILSLVLIIGCAEEKAKLINNYYTYCKCILTLLSVSCLMNLIASIRNMFGMCSYYESPTACSLGELLDIIIYFAVVAFHVYIMLLVRSKFLEIADSQLKSANYATDTEANIDGETNKYKVTEIKKEADNNDK